MKYFLDSAKIEEIKYAYNTFGIDGVTTNPRHIMVSGKPFMTVMKELADWVKEEGMEGYEKFPISVEIKTLFIWWSYLILIWIGNSFALLLFLNSKENFSPWSTLPKNLPFKKTSLPLEFLSFDNPNPSTIE